MSTHNIGFYEDLTKIIFELSSNIIKYAPYFFCCMNTSFGTFVSVILSYFDPTSFKGLCPVTFIAIV